MPKVPLTKKKTKQNKKQNKKQKKKQALFLTAEEIFSQILRKEFLQHLLYKTCERRLKRITNWKVISDITSRRAIKKEKRQIVGVTLGVNPKTPKIKKSFNTVSSCCRQW